MAAVEAPVIVEAPTADTAVETPPTPPEVAPPAEGDVQTPEGDQESTIDLTAAEDAIAAEVERRVSEQADRVATEAAKRTVTRTKEADDGEAARTNLYAVAEQQAQRSAAELRRMAAEGTLDDAGLSAHFNPIIAGVQAIAARDNETTVKSMLTLLPDLTAEETQTLEPLLYEFRRNGRLEKVPEAVLNLALARKDTEIADLKKQLRDRTAIKEAAAKLAAAGVAAGPGVGAETPKGVAVATMTKTAFEALPLDEQEKVPPAERRRIYESAHAGR
jgi:hypothetical protein